MYKLKPAKQSDILLLIEFKLATIFGSSENIEEVERSKIISYVENFIPANIKYYKIIVFDNKKVRLFFI